MAFVTLDRVKVTSSTTGTGTLTLGSATDGFQDFSGVGDGNQTYYAITGGTDYEVGIGTYTASGTTLSRDQVFASSNSGALVNLGAGDKEVFIPFPAEGTQGSSATGDDSSIGTDLTSWNNFKKILNKGVTGGVTFKNNNTNGVVSTYSVVYTPASSFNGGVLAQNGNIYCIPTFAGRGQIINPTTGVVSTYSLVFTAEQFQGGVLASNGDIHFIPYNPRVGQKISASGVVSTYSLVYTGNAFFTGGVLAPNGDIHFVPNYAAVGQKISAAGVVSTYSLVYTSSAAYAGGVLAPNGDIHFVPRSARVGQKVSAAGVVSTYSLIYTTSTAYQGGVLAPNGDIHFVPYNAPGVGQKINTTTGVVSTYSLIYTPTGAYFGGVLAPNGDIHFITDGAPVGQKISTCAANPLPSEACLSSYLNKL
jgi:hypothetical protein